MKKQNEARQQKSRNAGGETSSQPSSPALFPLIVEDEASGGGVNEPLSPPRQLPGWC